VDHPKESYGLRKSAEYWRLSLRKAKPIKRREMMLVGLGTQKLWKGKKSRTGYRAKKEGRKVSEFGRQKRETYTKRALKRNE